MRKHILFIITAFWFLNVHSANGQVFYVTPDGTGDGSSWAMASSDLYLTLEFAQAGAEVWVAEGFYTPTSCTNCTIDDRNVSLQVKSDVQLYGGFVGTETSLAERDWENHPTIISGEIDDDDSLTNNSTTLIFLNRVSANTVVDGFILQDSYADFADLGVGSKGNSGGAIYNIGSFGGDISNPVIRNCTFDNNYAEAFGGALYSDGSFNGEASPTIENCVFTNNTAQVNGGAILSQANFAGIASPIFTNCEFIDNNALDGNGGALEVQGSETGVANPVFTNCIFEDNSAINSGGAMRFYGKGGVCSPEYYTCTFVSNHAEIGGALYFDGSFVGETNAIIDHCNFMANSSDEEGACIFNLGSNGGVASPSIRNCIFEENHSFGSGAAIFNNGIEGTSNPQIIACEFLSNTADNYGGAIYNQGKTGECSPDILNCIFYKNQGSSAGAIYNLGSQYGDSSPSIINCTFFGNTADVGGAVYSNASDTTGTSSPLIANCIFYKNSAPLGEVFRNIYSSPTIEYSMVDVADCEVLNNGIEPAVNCGDFVFFDSEPMFVDTLNGDLRLVDSSMGIDIGNNEVIIELGVFVDLDDNARVHNGQVDLGAYEWGSGESFLTITTQPQSQTLCEGLSTSLNVEVSASGALEYQWIFEGVDIQGANESTLDFDMIELTDAGMYQCRIATKSTEVLSDVATLDITAKTAPAASIVADIDSVICIGQTLVFEHTLTDAGANPQINWLINDVLVQINGATFTYSEFEDGDQVSLSMTTDFDCVTSNTNLSNIWEVAVSPSCNVAVAELPAPTDFKLYPNPADSKIHIYSEQMHGLTFLSITNITGQTLYKEAFTSSKLQKVLDIAHLAAGIYVLKATSESHQVIIKFKII